MRELSAQHLIIGSGLVGLAVADRLLAAGHSGIVLVDKAPTAGLSKSAARDVLLTTGDPSLLELERVGLEYLHAWNETLGEDPRFRRCGSISHPIFLESDDATTLDAETVTQRVPYLRIDEGDVAIFHPEDGVVDSTRITTALAASVRERGAHFAYATEVGALIDDPEARRVRFESSHRHGEAETVYVAAGLGTPRILEAMGVEFDGRATCWNTFELDAEPHPPAVLRLEDVGGLVTSDGHGRLTLVLPDPDATSGPPRVRWDLLESFRRDHADRFPELSAARVRRGSAETRWDLGEPYREHFDGRVRIAGAFGLHSLPIAFGVAARMVAPPESTAEASTPDN